MKRIEAKISDEINAAFQEYAKSKKRSAGKQLAWMIEEELKKEGWIDSQGKVRQFTKKANAS